MFAHILLGLVALSIGRQRIQAAPSNITVDDSSPASTSASIAYSPPDTWSYGPTCSYCSTKPDSRQTHNGTWQNVSWHPTSDATKAETATLQFTGSGLYVFMVIPATSGAPDGGVHLTFTLDNEPAGSYDALGTPEGFVYNVSVYSNATIPDGQHTFVLQNGGHSNQSSLALLDYMVYTMNPDTPTDQPGSDGAKSSSSSGTAGTALQASTTDQSSPTGASTLPSAPALISSRSPALSGTTLQTGTTEQSSSIGAPTLPNAPVPTSSGSVALAGTTPQASTTDQSSPTSASTLPNAPAQTPGKTSHLHAILAVVLTIVGVVLITAGMLWWYRRGRKPVRMRNGSCSMYRLDPFTGLPSQGGLLREKGRETRPEAQICQESQTEVNQETGTEPSRGTEIQFETRISSAPQTRQEVETLQETYTRIETQTRPETQRAAVSQSNIEAGSITPEVAPPSYEQALLERPS